MKANLGNQAKIYTTMNTRDEFRNVSVTKWAWSTHATVSASLLVPAAGLMQAGSAAATADARSYTLCLKKFPPLNSVTLSNLNRFQNFALLESI